MLRPQRLTFVVDLTSGEGHLAERVGNFILETMPEFTAELLKGTSFDPDR
jgi:hypothetical protein